MSKYTFYNFTPSEIEYSYKSSIGTNTIIVKANENTVINDLPLDDSVIHVGGQESKKKQTIKHEKGYTKLYTSGSLGSTLYMK